MERSRSSYVVLAVFIGTALLTLIHHALSIGVVANVDQFVYAESARLLLSGQQLYTEVWIDKPPPALWIFMPPALIAPRSFLALQIWFAMIVVLQAALCVRFLRLDPILAVGAIFLATLFPVYDKDLSWLSLSYYGNLVTLGVLIASHRMVVRERCEWTDCLIAGAGTIFAFHIKQNLLLIGIVPLVTLLMNNGIAGSRWRGFSAFLAGGLGAWALLIPLSLLTTDLDSYFRVTFVYPFEYAGATDRDDLGMAYREFAITPMLLLPLMLWASLLATRYRFYATALLASGILICLAPRKPYPHYLIHLIPFSLLLLTCFGRVVKQAPPRLAVTAFVAVTMVTGVVGNLVSFSKAKIVDNMERVVEIIDRVTPQDETLFVAGFWKCTYLPFASKARHAHMIWVSYALNPFWNKILPMPIDQVKQDYLKAPPHTLVVEDVVANGRARFPVTREIVIRLRKRYPYREIANEPPFKVFVLERRSPEPSAD